MSDCQLVNNSNNKTTISKAQQRGYSQYKGAELITIGDRLFLFFGTGSSVKGWG